jgi:hypothetical protein
MVFLKIYLVVIIVNTALKKANWALRKGHLIIAN